MKIPNKRELQQIALNHSSDIDFKDSMKIYKKCTVEPYSFLVNGTTLQSDDSLTRFWLGFFMDIKWLGITPPPPPPPPPPIVISRTKQVRNMNFCMGLPCLKYFLKM